MVLINPVKLWNGGQVSLPPLDRNVQKASSGIVAWTLQGKIYNKGVCCTPSKLQQLPSSPISILLACCCAVA